MTAPGAWCLVTIVVNGSMVGAASWSGGVSDRAVEASRVDFAIAIAARHDGIVRGAYGLGRSATSYRIHRLMHDPGQ